MNWSAANPWMLVGAGLALVGLLALGQRVYEGRRAEALREAAARLGLYSLPDASEITQQPFAQLPLFGEGYRRAFPNVSRREGLWIFGLRYTTTEEKRRTNHMQTVAAMRVAGVSLPAFAARPMGEPGRAGPVLAGRDIAFAEDPEFGRRFRLRGSDEAAVRKLFTAELRAVLLAEPELSVEGEGAWLLCYRRGQRVAPDELGEFVARVERFAEAFSQPR